MGVVQNSIDIQKIIEAGGDPEIAAKVQELEAEIGDENSGIIKDIDDLQEANALVMTSVSSLKSVVGNDTSGLVKKVNDIETNLTVTDLSSNVEITSGTLNDYNNFVFKCGNMLFFSLRVNGATVSGYNECARIKGVNIKDKSKACHLIGYRGSSNTVEYFSIKNTGSYIEIQPHNTLTNENYTIIASCIMVE